MDQISSQRSELEELRSQAGQITDESLESTRRMLSLVEESEEAGRCTIETLNIQGEQLKRIEQGMDHIKADVSKAERSLSRLKRCCNVCTNPWKKVSTLDDTDSMYCKYKKEKSNNIVVDQPQSIKPPNRRLHENSSTRYIKLITNDAREQEMEANLCQVNSAVCVLQNMALDMNSELSSQNEKIQRINTQGNANAIRLEMANIAATDLLNS